MLKFIQDADLPVRIIRRCSISKLELNSKKSNSSDAKICIFLFRLGMSFIFALKARLQILKFEFCQIKLENNNG